MHSCTETTGHKKCPFFGSWTEEGTLFFGTPCTTTAAVHMAVTRIVPLPPGFRKNMKLILY